MSDDKQNNLNKALKKIKEAAIKKAQIVCLPELFNLQYFPQNESDENFKLAEEIPNKTTKALSEAAKENNVAVVGGSIFETQKTKRQKNSPLKEANFFDKNFFTYYNTSVIFDSDGSILGKYRKIHIPYDTYFYEKRYFTAGNKYEIFATSAAKISSLICYDQWFPEAARVCALKGAQIIFYPTAIGWFDELKKLEPFSQERWIRDQCSHASANGVYVAVSNRVGKEGKIDFWGNSFVADPFGNVIARASSTKGELLIADIDLGLIEKSQQGWGFLQNRRPETYLDLVKKVKN